jgi:hypothetical protein
MKATYTRRWLFTSSWAGVFAYPVELLSQGQKFSRVRLMHKTRIGKQTFPAGTIKTRVPNWAISPTSRGARVEGRRTVPVVQQEGRRGLAMKERFSKSLVLQPLAAREPARLRRSQPAVGPQLAPRKHLCLARGHCPPLSKPGRLQPLHSHGPRHDQGTAHRAADERRVLHARGGCPTRRHLR